MTIATEAPREATRTLNLRSLLEEMIERGASDLHVTAGERPKLRVDGHITDSVTDYILTPKDALEHRGRDAAEGHAAARILRPH